MAGRVRKFRRRYRLDDLNGRFLATNSAYQRMVGYSADEFRSRFMDITHEDDRSTTGAHHGTLGGTRDQFQIEKRYWRKDGALIWVRNSVSLAPGSESMPVAIMAIVEDITERKQTEEHCGGRRRVGPRDTGSKSGRNDGFDCP